MSSLGWQRQNSKAKKAKVDAWEDDQEFVDTYKTGGCNADQGVEGADSSTAPVRNAGAGNAGHSERKVERLAKGRRKSR